DPLSVPPSLVESQNEGNSSFLRAIALFQWSESQREKHKQLFVEHLCSYREAYSGYPRGRKKNSVNEKQTNEEAQKMMIPFLVECWRLSLLSSAHAGWLACLHLPPPHGNAGVSDATTSKFARVLGIQTCPYACPYSLHPVNEPTIMAMITISLIIIIVITIIIIIIVITIIIIIIIIIVITIIIIIIVITIIIIIIIVIITINIIIIIIITITIIIIIIIVITTIIIIVTITTLSL
ncbi:hypothetical protein STEG23_004157, partial [Scotinomys teguina]